MNLQNISQNVGIWLAAFGLKGLGTFALWVVGRWLTHFTLSGREVVMKYFDKKFTRVRSFRQSFFFCLQYAPFPPRPRPVAHARRGRSITR